MLSPRNWQSLVALPGHSARQLAAALAKAVQRLQSPTAAAFGPAHRIWTAALCVWTPLALVLSLPRFIPRPVREAIVVAGAVYFALFGIYLALQEMVAPLKGVLHGHGALRWVRDVCTSAFFMSEAIKRGRKLRAYLAAQGTARAHRRAVRQVLAFSASAAVHLGAASALLHGAV